MNYSKIKKEISRNLIWLASLLFILLLVWLLTITLALPIVSLNKLIFSSIIILDYLILFTFLSIIVVSKNKLNLLIGVGLDAEETEEKVVIFYVRMLTHFLIVFFSIAIFFIQVGAVSLILKSDFISALRISWIMLLILFTTNLIILYLFVYILSYHLNISDEAKECYLEYEKQFEDKK